VRVVDVCEDPEQLAIQVLASENVVFRKVVRPCGERGWIIEKVLSPSENKVDVDRCSKLNWLAIGIYPRVVEPAGTETPTPWLVPAPQPGAPHLPRACSHRWTQLRRTEF